MKGNTFSADVPGPGEGMGEQSTATDASGVPDSGEALARRMLTRWAEAAEELWLTLPDEPEMGFFGSGFIHWGVQSNLNYAAALATLGADPSSARRDHWRARALAALRFALATHITGHRPGSNGGSWGRSWISVLGLERAMQGLRYLRHCLSGEEARALRRVMTDEAQWLLTEGNRNGRRDVLAGLWDASGRNAPESNIWNGAFLWRVAQMYPDAEGASAWAERAHDYLVNGVSVASDATNPTLAGGRSVASRHVGANFFPNHALDHHGYLNVGYGVICVSNAALLHFDAKAEGWDPPDSLHNGQAALWRILRRMIFPDGRLFRMGGDSRVRYSYCQEYLIPAALYAADQHGDAHAPGLAAAYLRLIEREGCAGRTGLFYEERLKAIQTTNPHYYARLESDRAVALAMYLNYLPLVRSLESPGETFEESVEGFWEEPEHGAVLHRGPRRLASFSWRANGLTQAHAQPPEGSDLAEWSFNLCPVIRFLGDPGERPGCQPTSRRLLHHWQSAFPGGFVTCGSVREGVDIRVLEGAVTTDQAETFIAFAALPDGRTCVGFQRVVAAADRLGYLVELKGLHLNVPNDLFNGNHRRLRSAAGLLELCTPCNDEIRTLGGAWVNIDEQIGVVALYGGDTLQLRRSGTRRGGAFPALFVEEICLGLETTVRRVLPGEVLLDLGFAVLSGENSEKTAAFSGQRLAVEGDLRAVSVKGAGGILYGVGANFGTTIGVCVGREIPPGEARVWRFSGDPGENGRVESLALGENSPP